MYTNTLQQPQLSVAELVNVGSGLISFQIDLAQREMWPPGERDG